MPIYKTVSYFSFLTYFQRISATLRGPMQEDRNQQFWYKLIRFVQQPNIVQLISQFVGQTYPITDWLSIEAKATQDNGLPILQFHIVNWITIEFKLQEEKPKMLVYVHLLTKIKLDLKIEWNLKKQKVKASIVFYGIQLFPIFKFKY